MSLENRFVKTRCPLCKKVLTEVSESTKGQIRSECSRCKTLVTISCQIGIEPKITDVRNKSVNSNSVNP